MRSNFVTVSAGNSFTSMAAFRFGRMVNVVRKPSNTPLDSALHTLLKDLGGISPRFGIALSVVPSAWEYIEACFFARGIRLFRAGREVGLGIDIAYEKPGSLGLDRAVCARAAFMKYGPCVVVDAGTAVTVDIVGKGPRFLGGAIAPGPEMMADALGERCALLPESLEIQGDVRFPPSSTEECIRFAVTIGFAGMVDSMVEKLRPFAGESAPCIATGGGAPLWREFSSIHSFHEPWLVHRGLALLARDLFPA